MQNSRELQPGIRQRKKYINFRITQFTGIKKFYRDRAKFRVLNRNAKSHINCKKSMRITTVVVNENGGKVTETYRKLDELFEGLINKYKETENENESFNEQELNMIMQMVDQIHDKEDIEAVMNMVGNMQTEDDFNAVMRIVDENIKCYQLLEIREITNTIYNEKELESAMDFLFPSTKSS